MEWRELSLIMLVSTALAASLFFIRNRRSPRAAVADWFATLALVLLLSGIAYAVTPAFGGWIGFGCFVLLVGVPLRLSSAAYRATRHGNYRRARTLARLAAVFHPFGRTVRLPTTVDIGVRIRRGVAPSAQELDELGARDDADARRQLDVMLAHVAGNYERVRELMADPIERRKIIAAGFGATWVRASEPRASAVLGAIGEAEKFDPTFAIAELRQLFLLEALAALGDVEGVRDVVEGLPARLSAIYGPRALAAAHLANGNKPAAESMVLETRQKAIVDPSTRHALDVLATRFHHPDEPALVRDSDTASAVARLRHEAALGQLLGFVTRRPQGRLTFALATVLCAVFLIQTATGDPLNPNDLEHLGALILPMTRGESWRLLTSPFLHAGVLHLLFNVIALLFFGRYVEALYGRARFVLLYLLCGVLSGLGVDLVTRHYTVLVGASGAIFGLAGGVLGALLKQPELRKSTAGARLIQTFALVLLLQLPFDALIPKVASSAHIGGVLAGFALSFLLAPNWRRLVSRH